MKNFPENVKLLTAFMTDQNGRTLADWAGGGPLLLVFLRHLGCVFNRQLLADLAANRERLMQVGILPVIIHMATDRQADMLLAPHGLTDLPRFSDSARQLYKAFGLRRATMRELLSPASLLRGVETCIRQRAMFAVPQGDPLQLPGYVLLEHGRITHEFIASQPWEKPDYRTLADERLMLLQA